MAIQLKSNCKIVNTSAVLAEVLTKLNDNELDFEQAQEIINQVYLSWKKLGFTGISFKEQLVRAGLDTYNFEINTDESLALPLLAIPKLDISNSELFRYRDTSKNKINGLFSHQVFDHLFINRSKTDNLNPYITSKSDFNIGIVNLKNHLASIIVEGLDIEELKNKRLFNSSGAVIENNILLYSNLMNHKKVGTFLTYWLDKVLEDPIKNELKLKILLALIVLNNFDSMLESELSGLISLNPAQKGLLHNNNYSQETTGNSTEYWAADTHEDKNMKNYTSNMAKFIMRQIPKVIKRRGKYTQINGQYLTPNDLYVLSAVLKLAEFEYNIKHPNEPVILAIDLVNGIRTLMNNRTLLPALKNTKVELLDSIESFLWKGDDYNWSISKLYRENFSRNQRILDVESLLAFEIYLSSSPTYIEMEDSTYSEDKNYGGVYAGGSALQNNLTDFLVALLQSKKKRLNKEYYNNGQMEKQNVDSPIIQVILTQALGFESPELYSDFVTKHIDILNTIAQELARVLHSSTGRDLTSIRTAVSLSDLKINLYNAVAKKVANIILSKIPFVFKDDYANNLSDRAITQFDSNSGSTIPVYRLNSAITHLQWFIHQYKTSERDPHTNILVDNPLLLSKYTDSTLDNFNSYYKGFANYFLGIGDSETYTSFNELPPSDQLALMTLLNLQAMKNGIFHFLPVCYSDKVSIGIIGLNMHTLFKDGSSIESILYLPNAIELIRKLDFRQRQKNLCVTINSILEKWHRFANSINYPHADSFKPVDEIDGYKRSRTEQTNKTLKIFNERYIALNTFLQTLPEHLFRAALKYASNNDFEFIDELDYVKTKAGISNNKSIALDFSLVQSVEKFNEYQNIQIEKALKSSEYLKMVESLKIKLSTAKKDDIIYKMLILDDSTPKFFKRKYNSKTRKYDVELVQGKDGLIAPFELEYRKQAALANMGRFAFIDLISKSYYLDPSKDPNLLPELDRAKRIDAMAKRMVLYPATIQAYQQGRINGVSQEVKVSVIEDPKERTWNLNGDVHNLDIYDGCGFISPFWSRMEDNSLPGHGIRGTKKTLGTSTRGLNSTLFKWAEFPITNEGMRMSHTSKYDLHTIFKKMHDEAWTEDIDITRSFTGALIDNPSQLIQKRMYVSDGFVNWMIAGIKKVGYNQYEIIKYEVNAKGEILDTDGNVLKKGNNTTNKVPSKSTQLVTIDSIYALWQELGGIQSMELIDGRLESSEASIDATFEYIINVGKKLEDNPEHWNLKTVRQPLRNKFIAICANKSAVKRGSANLNTAQSAWQSIDSLNYFRINTSCFGIQLDANHHADLSDVREMSQTISTLAGNGYTMDLAELAYTSIGDLVSISLKKVNKYLSALEKQGVEESIRLISERLVLRLASEEKISSVDAFVEMFSEDLNTTLPISDRRFYKLFIKEILEDLNKSSIRRRYSGLGGILNPASNIVQIFTVRGLTYTYSTLLKKARKELSKNLNIVRALLKFTTDTSRDKDLDIVRYYIISLVHPDWSIEQIISSLDNEITQSVRPHESNIIKVLDTIRYRLKGDTEWTTKTLDSHEAMLEYKAFLDANTNYITGETNVELELVLSKPHDLRPQSISWTTLHQTAEGVEEKPQSVYTTIGAKLSRSVGNIAANAIDIDSTIAELSQLGQELKQQCEL